MTLTEEKLNASYKKWFGKDYNPLNDNDVNRASFLQGGETEPSPPRAPVYGPWDSSDPHIRLRGGRKFHFLRFKPSDIFIEDIAHSLSRQCRFGGYTEGFYSVAQHSIHVSTLCKEAPLWGLLHDAAEAYIGDICRPWKSLLWFHHDDDDVWGSWNGPVRTYESRIQEAIAHRFNLPWPMPECIHEADNEAGKYEWDHALEHDWVGWRPEVAKQAFLERFAELGGKEHGTT